MAADSKISARQEAFVQNLVAKGMNATAAYKAAGYSGKGNVAEAGASEILRNPKVAARLAELQAEAASEAKISVKSLTDDLIRLRNLAEANSQPAAGVAAVGMIAKLHGLVVDRQELRAEVVTRPSADENAPAEMSLEDWQAKYGGSSGPGIDGSGNGKLIEHEH